MAYARAVTSAFPLHRYTYQDYVWLEEESSTRHEFLFGEITAMVRGTPEHAAMAAEIIGQLREQLEGKPCRVFTSDLGVRVMATGLATYPDASVVCGPTQRDPEKKTNVLNPRVLVEITSDSTEAYDRGEKLAHYQRIASLREVMLVAHDERRVDLWRRVDERWTQISAHANDEVALHSLGDLRLLVDAIYFDPLA